MQLNSYDEWSPLREAVVGSAVNFMTLDMDLSSKLFFHNYTRSIIQSGYGQDAGRTATGGRPRPSTRWLRKQSYIEELCEDLDGLASTLEDLGVKVYRPMEIQPDAECRTPYWETSCNAALNVRDQTIVLGDEILETPPLVRSRYFENDLLKPVFYRYFRQGARWTVMPKPIMTDRSFDRSYVEAVSSDLAATHRMYPQQSSSYDVGHEIMIDAAQCIRFGKDLLINVATANHELGFQWLQRHLGDRFRLHRVHRLSDNHIDSMLLPLRPGKLLVRSSEFVQQLPEPLRKWDIIVAPEPAANQFPVYGDDDLILTSRYIDVNVLSIDQQRVLVNSLFPELIQTLESHGFTAIPVKHRHRRLFAGGIRCDTLDLVRDGSQEDCFYQ